MKCPKCGYLGFETTDRCRNCGYDFSLTPTASSAELPLRAADADASMVDLALGDARLADDGESNDLEAPRLALDASTSGASRLTPPGRTAAPDAPAAAAPADAAEELPLFAPRPAGPPLSVRRPGTEVPRARRTTTTRPSRAEAPSLPLVSEAPAVESSLGSFPTGRAVARPVAAGMAGRLAASLIDIAILGSIDLLVVWLTMRIAGLGLTADDLLVIRPLPMAAFFLVLAFLYLVGFTIGGGQSVGKMAMGIRVIGDDQRGVDLTGAVVRALGALLSVCTLGLLFLPVFFSAERRALHDRLAGTRVVVG